MGPQQQLGRSSSSTLNPEKAREKERDRAGEEEGGRRRRGRRCARKTRTPHLGRGGKGFKNPVWPNRTIFWRSKVVCPGIVTTRFWIGFSPPKPKIRPTTKNIKNNIFYPPLRPGVSFRVVLPILCTPQIYLLFLVFRCFLFNFLFFS